MMISSTDMKTIDPRRAALVAWSNSTRLIVFCLATFGLGLSAGIAQTPGSELPTGYADIAVAAGNGTAKTTTLVSIPMLEDVPSNLTGSKTGRITGVTSNTITVANANWTAGALSTAATPYLLEITSGAAQGLMLLVSAATANTADTVTIDAAEITRVGNLTALGISTESGAGDTFRLWPADTLGSFFGTPESTGIQGGTSATSADTVVLVINGSATTYFYNTATTPPRWSRAGINSDASNVAVPPYAGVQYSRLGASPLKFRVLGRMPVGSRKVAIKNSGTTLLSPYWPVNQTLSSLGLHNLPGWQSGSSATTTDTVVLTSNGSATTYYYDGTNWRRAGINSNANAVVVPPGASLLISKRGSASGFTIYQHTAPYSSQ
jgi:hypothetical protein